MDTGMLFVTALLGVGVVAIAAITMDSEYKDPVKDRYLSARKGLEGDDALRQHIAGEKARYNALIPRTRVPGHDEMEAKVDEKRRNVDAALQAYRAARDVAPTNFDQQFRHLNDAQNNIARPVGLEPPQLLQHMNSYVQRRADHAKNNLDAPDVADFMDVTKVQVNELGIHEKVKTILDDVDTSVYEKGLNDALAAARNIAEVYQVFSDEEPEPGQRLYESKRDVHMRKFAEKVNEHMALVDNSFATGTSDDIVADVYKMIKDQASKYKYPFTLNPQYEGLCLMSEEYLKTQILNKNNVDQDITLKVNSYKNVFIPTLTRMARRLTLWRASEPVWVNFEHDCKLAEAILKHLDAVPADDHMKIVHFCVGEVAKKKIRSIKAIFNKYDAQKDAVRNLVHAELRLIQHAADKVAPMTTLLMRTQGKFLETMPLVLDMVYAQMQRDWTAIVAAYTAIMDGTANREVMLVLPHMYSDFKRQLPYVTITDDKFANHTAVSQYAIAALERRFKSPKQLTANEFPRDWAGDEEEVHVDEWDAVDTADKFINFVGTHAYPGMNDPDSVYEQYELKQYDAFNAVYLNMWKNPAARRANFMDSKYAKAMYHPEMYLPGFDDALLPPAKKAQVAAFMRAVDASNAIWYNAYTAIGNGAVLSAARRFMGARYRRPADHLLGLKDLHDGCAPDANPVVAAMDTDKAMRTDMYSLFSERKARLGVNDTFFAPIDPAYVTDMKNWVTSIAVAAAAGDDETKGAAITRILKCVRSSGELIDLTNPQLTAVVDRVKNLVNNPAAAAVEGTWQHVLAQDDHADDGEFSGKEMEFIEYLDKSTRYASIYDDTLNPQFDALLTSCEAKAQAAVTDADMGDYDSFDARLQDIDINHLNRNFDLTCDTSIAAINKFDWTKRASYAVDANLSTIAFVFDAGEIARGFDKERLAILKEQRERIAALPPGPNRVASVAEANMIAELLRADHAVVFA